MSNIAEVAIYARLSLEDRDVLKRNSTSINNQIEIAKRYIIEHDMILKEIYIDDGVSGTTYDRPGFNALLEGVKRKLFNTIIVKDLSRLGRNYIEVGKKYKISFNYGTKQNISDIHIDDPD